MAVMSQVNPAGAASLGLIETLIDLLQKPDSSRIEVAMARYRLDPQGMKIMDDAGHSIAIRSFEVKEMSSDTQAKLRRELEAVPLSCLMVLWMAGIGKDSKLGAATFDTKSFARKARASTLDEVDRFVIKDYIQRHRESVEAGLAGKSETVQ
jgi:hypothetical protein